MGPRSALSLGFQASSLSSSSKRGSAGALLVWTPERQVPAIDWREGNSYGQTPLLPWFGFSDPHAAARPVDSVFFFLPGSSISVAIHTPNQNQKG